MRVSIQSDFGNVSRSIEDFNLTNKQLTQFHSDAIDIIKEHSDDIFATQGRAGGGAWKPLSRATKRARRRRQGHYAKAPNNPGILRRTGALQDNVDKKSNKRRGEITWKTEYAKYHMSGRNKRVFAELSNETTTQMIKKLQEQIEEQVQAFNRGSI